MSLTSACTFTTDPSVRFAIGDAVMVSVPATPSTCPRAGIEANGQMPATNNAAPIRSVHRTSAKANFILGHLLLGPLRPRREQPGHLLSGHDRECDERCDGEHVRDSEAQLPVERDAGDDDAG